MDRVVVAGGMRLAARERDEVVQVLQDGFGEGRLSPNTFGWRLQVAWCARSRRELRQLVADLPARGWLERVGRWWQGLGRTLGLVVGELPAPLLLPVPESEPFTIGRSRETCDLVLSGDSRVSARHAELRVVEGCWVLTDLRSTNGTWVNGARLVHSAVVGPGDRVCFGDQQFILITGSEPTLAPSAPAVSG